MPRINIEDSLFRDNRFVNLCIKLGGLEVALGAMVRAWCLAQKYYLQGSGRIPADKWVEQGIKNEILEVGLAERVGDEIRVKGDVDQFGWLKQRSDAGKKGGLATQEVKRSLVGRLTGDSKKPSGREASISSSSSSSSSFSFSNSKNKELKSEAPLSLPPKIDPVVGKENRVPELVAVYVDAYKAKYGARPVIDGKSLGLLKNLVKHMPVDTAKDMIQVYLQIDDDWFKKKYHDLVTFSNSLNKISACLQTGKEKPAEEQNWNKFWEEVGVSGTKHISKPN